MLQSTLTLFQRKELEMLVIRNDSSSYLFLPFLPQKHITFCGKDRENIV